MARIVLGICTSHGPQLATPADQWGQRVIADRRESAHPFRGGSYGFDELVALRASEGLEHQITESVWRERHDACQAALDRLAVIYEETGPDAAVILGNDQRELFFEDVTPAFCVFHGAQIRHAPLAEEQLARLPPGIAAAMQGYCPPRETMHAGLPDLGRHVVEQLMAQGFDVATSTLLPKGSDLANGIPHAYGFVYRRIMKDRVIPNLPVIQNTFYPPNQPSAARCFAFGRALCAAIASWQSNDRVAVFGSGGLSHFVIDEEFDRRILDAMKRKDRSGLAAENESLFQSGTSETKNWITAAGVLHDTGLEMRLVNYVPCYRSVAGTGTAMAFAYWR